MSNEAPSLSTKSLSIIECSELQELQQIEIIRVWGQTQEVLENHALQELHIFQDEDKEDGEISDHTSGVQRTNAQSKSMLDINNYLRSQDDLKKKYEYKKTLKPIARNQDVADRITEKLKISKTPQERKDNKKKRKSDEDINRQAEKRVRKEDSDSDYLPSDGELSDYEHNVKLTKSVKRIHSNSDLVDKVVDDGNIHCYERRLEDYYKNLENNQFTDDNQSAELVQISKQLKINSKVWKNLYRYQQEGVQWLWNLHKKSTGGLLGDEMGLGKTVQVIAFLSSLRSSHTLSSYCSYTGLGPTIIVCPTTVIHQWVQHFHCWAPEMRVAVVHKSGNFNGNQSTLIKDIFKNKGVIVTSYFGILKFKNVLVDLDWHYIVLDEGHKIRTPTAKITVAVKEFRTPHKLILTGSPMQNNLQELWSLFDFACPSMLGSLPVFTEHFVSPILQGGYTNASQIQEATALEMATLLKDMVTPYLLRRCKADLKDDLRLPQKTEQVLFCSLTDEQRNLYKGFLMGSHVESILNKGSKAWFAENRTRAQVFVGITMLRKICNHPDIYLDELENSSYMPENQESHGYYKRSGKMVVVSALLKIWKKQKHRILLFTQSRAMVGIFEEFLQSQNYKYLKMDGSTSVHSRQALINTFNQDSSYDVFLLTTRVGGLGVNLTGANRVIIYDPDWNPATDTQARERAWRIGQEKEVIIYRLISAGTIEEKMYQRQVWKQLLSNKILLDPRTQKFFTTSDLHDLFSLQEPTQHDSETGNIFKNARVSVQEKLKSKKSRKSRTNDNKNDIVFSEDKIEEMKRKAQEISKTITFKTESETPKKKYPHEIEEELETQHKQAERKYMKTLTPPELMEYNRRKLDEKEDATVNKVDSFDTGASFSQALEACENASKIYRRMKQEKLDVEVAQDKYENIKKKIVKEKSTGKCKKRHRDKGPAEVDKTGKIDGEKVENLVKMETRKRQEGKEEGFNRSQDDYVLEKLFSKKGIHSALEHDLIVDGNSKNKPNRFRVHTEAQMKTEQALHALRKSRLRDWRW